MNRMVSDKLTTSGGSTCPVCGDADLPTAVDLGDYRLFACRACGCWSSDAAHRGASTSFQPAAYFEHDRADLPRWRRLVDSLPFSEGTSPRVLDVGCGTGAFLEFIGKRFPHPELWGIELDPERAARARARVPSATVVAADAREGLRRLEGRFDLITLWDVFEHLPEPAAVLQQLGRLLSPEGRLYIQTIHEDSLLPRLGRLGYRLSGGRMRYAVRRTHEAHHLVFFSLRGLEILAQESRLLIERRWFDRLAWRRMDGPRVLTLAAASVLAFENWLGNGLFVNLLLRHSARGLGALAEDEEVLSDRPLQQAVEVPAHREGDPVV